MSVIDDLTSVYLAVNTPAEGVAVVQLPTSVTIEGKTRPTPNYTGKPDLNVGRSAPVAVPVPITGGSTIHFELMFELDDHGWREGFHRNYSASDATVYTEGENLLKRYIPLRRSVLSNSAYIVGARMSIVGVRGDSVRRVGSGIGLGAGLRTGTPASPNEGIQFNIHDLSRAVRANIVLGGWAEADLVAGASVARDRGGTTAIANAAAEMVKTLYLKGTNGAYADSGTPVIESYDRRDAEAPLITVDDFLVDDDGYLQLVFAADPGWARGDQVYLRMKRNRFISGKSGLYYVLDNSPDPEGFAVTINTGPSAPIGNWAAVIATAQQHKTAFYESGFVEFGLYTRRSNGGTFFERRGRRSARRS